MKPTRKTRVKKLDPEIYGQSQWAKTEKKIPKMNHTKIRTNKNIQTKPSHWVATRNAKMEQKQQKEYITKIT